MIVPSRPYRTGHSKFRYLSSPRPFRRTIVASNTANSRQYSFLSFLAIFELGSVLCGAAQSSAMLIIGRAVAGMGGSGLTNGAFTIVGASIPMEKRPAMLGIVISISQTGILIAPVIGGALAQYSTWRWCKYVLYARYDVHLY